MANKLIKNALIINEGEKTKGHILIEDKLISKILPENSLPNISGYEVIDANGLLLLPGVIDDQVHFREPGLNHKGDLYTESKAAIAGGVTSFMEMPNTIPQATTIDLLEKKYEIAQDKSLANHSFYLGATNDNIDEILKINPENICGVKVFMGSSTGNMLVNKPEALINIFKNSPVLIATHSEDEDIIKSNTQKYNQQFEGKIPISYHPIIRNEEACYKSSSLAVELASKYGSRLHILHISTAKELQLFDANKASKDKSITSEVCVHHLWFSEDDYESFGPRIKWNPAIKTKNDRDNLLKGVLNNKIDVIATDHAPHTIEEKQINSYPKNFNYLKSASGGPLVQHSLPLMLEFYKHGKMSIEKIIEKMCHTPADIFNIYKRGYIREGYYADIVLINPDHSWEVDKSNILYKCGWSPFEGQKLSSKVTHTFINGNLVYKDGVFDEQKKGMRLVFKR